MLSYCFKNKKGKLLILSKFAFFNSKNLRFINELAASRLLKSLGIKTLLSKIPLVGPFLLKEYWQY